MCDHPGPGPGLDQDCRFSSSVLGPDHGSEPNFGIPNYDHGRNCFDAFMWGSLSHDNIGPFLGISLPQSGMEVILASPENGRLQKWRHSTNPSVSKIQQIVFEVAKAIQYVHSIGIMFRSFLAANDIFVDFDNQAKLQCYGFCPNYLCKGQFDYNGYSSSFEANIHEFGLLFYQVLFNKETNDIETRPSEPEIPDNVWQLIQWCCADDPKERPTIDQVVQEMESWISLGQSTLST
ncbi:hypothetical protein M378DRAFT_18181 [Amanita muscaria Koide BX008]|uniref:Tyrosine-protein kinase catalytic domain-containing protein n=1 Tax=Amanita muscaria (strain Koide BX008) TaxID=946122 RepID=A0A0C2WF05_AMAMK|nr:hypothetical protein M378DRAFT_18181 [Amanita muscaria Koide BX008]